MTKDLKIYNIIIDIVLFVATVALLGLFYSTILEVFPARERGFFCNDPNIQYLYEGDTITLHALLLAVFLPPVLLFGLGEVLFYAYRAGHRRRQRYVFKLCKLSVHPIIVSIYQKTGLYLFGAALMFLFVLLGKRMGGQLRPHFLDTCQPDYALFNCSDGLIEGDVCNGDPGQIQDARESFPSGHAAVGFYSMMFSAMYIEARLKWRSARLVKPFLQGLCLMVACACAASRIYDNRHHPSDVLWGSVLGILLAYFIAYFVSDLYNKSRRQNETDDSSEYDDDDANEMKTYKQNLYARPRTRRAYDEERYL